MRQTYNEDLLDLFTSLYDEPGSAKNMAERVGLSLKLMKFDGMPLHDWMAVIRQAERQDKLDALIALVEKDYPNSSIIALKGLPKDVTVRGPKLDPGNWKRTDFGQGELEKLMGSQATFLPISFLEIGLSKARSVVRLEFPDATASGFITSNDLLITNHHVLPNELSARNVKVQFNYQETPNGLSSKISEYTLLPDAFFLSSSSNGGDDWTAVRVDGNVSDEWGAIELDDMQVRTDDYVNIIQHPAGRPKQIAMYHNVVAYADSSRVQYLTDTQPGSSGSPVFDSQWRLVAIHHSGGWLAEPGKQQLFFRNEGIAVRALIRGLSDSGVL